MIRGELGAAPWDVLHIGLHKQFGLSIGSWSIIAGGAVLAASGLLMREWPHIGAYLNMILFGVFIDAVLNLPFMVTPGHWLPKTVMFLSGMVIYAYGMAFYISAGLGAGPRDSFMLALKEITGWKVSRVRSLMEVTVLIAGWLLGGPVFIGTLIFSLGVGTVTGYSLPQCERFTAAILAGIDRRKKDKDSKRRASV